MPLAYQNVINLIVSENEDHSKNHRIWIFTLVFIYSNCFMHINVHYIRYGKLGDEYFFRQTRFTDPEVSHELMFIRSWVFEVVRRFYLILQVQLLYEYNDWTGTLTVGILCLSVMSALVQYLYKCSGWASAVSASVQSELKQCTSSVAV